MAKSFKLLTTQNPKVLKGEAWGYATYILHLAPAKLSGWNVCPMASVGCKFSCLNTAGHGGIFKPGEDSNTIQVARIARTTRFFTEREQFMRDLVSDVSSAITEAVQHDLYPVFRLNGTSDIRWETIPVDIHGITFPNIMSVFPVTQFYDYTKLPNRTGLPDNYHLTFSRSESNSADVTAWLKTGRNVAAVFRTVEYPDSFAGVPVFPGDHSDLRFLDPSPVVVALYAKGRAKKDTSGFVID